ncbi:hypothetical protein PoB_005901600 [Plakobranchus ocellatus]|uniref:Uncharacterized protein n=1 Tax=Plakobranchus ocellatus TaxID=259542 RepID=A0AAV4CI30_9GAST|nr:hypothetical protein PoB_005901600 [Plakobranchus ocellatus]
MFPCHGVASQEDPPLWSADNIPSGNSETNSRVDFTDTEDTHVNYDTSTAAPNKFLPLTYSTARHRRRSVKRQDTKRCRAGSLKGKKFQSQQQPIRLRKRLASADPKIASLLADSILRRVRDKRQRRRAAPCPCVCVSQSDQSESSDPCRSATTLTRKPSLEGKLGKLETTKCLEQYDISSIQSDYDRPLHTTRMKSKSLRRKGESTNRYFNKAGSCPEGGVPVSPSSLRDDRYFRSILDTQRNRTAGENSWFSWSQAKGTLRELKCKAVTMFSSRSSRETKRKQSTSAANKAEFGRCRSTDIICGASNTASCVSILMLNECQMGTNGSEAKSKSTTSACTGSFKFDANCNAGKSLDPPSKTDKEEETQARFLSIHNVQSSLMNHRFFQKRKKQAPAEADIVESSVGEIQDTKEMKPNERQSVSQRASATLTTKESSLLSLTWQVSFGKKLKSRA